MKAECQTHTGAQQSLGIAEPFCKSCLLKMKVLKPTLLACVILYCLG